MKERVVCIMTKKGLCSLLVAAILIISISCAFSFKVFAASSVKMGHASISETGDDNGEKGDQTGQEVFTCPWYVPDLKWEYVIRAKDSSVAEKIAVAMEQACENDKIGYGQADRTTLYMEAKKKNWNLSAISNPCNTDCSALVAVCVNAAGIQVSENMATGDEKEILLGTGCFDVYTSNDYIGKDENLKRGDILLRPKKKTGWWIFGETVPGHTAVVLTNGKNNPSYYPSCSSSYTSIVDALNSIGVNSSYSHRSTIASANNITNYSGTASQNTTMLNLLKQGRLINPDGNTSTEYFPACASHYTSIVDALNSIGANSSFS